MTKVELTILSVENNSVRTRCNTTQKEVTYNLFLLRKRYELGVVKITNPEMLYKLEVTVA